MRMANALCTLGVASWSSYGSWPDTCHHLGNPIMCTCLQQFHLRLVVMKPPCLQLVMEVRVKRLQHTQYNGREDADED